jgi:hypothetical protein
MQTRKGQDNHHMETTGHQNSYDENCHFKSYYL